MSSEGQLKEIESKIADELAALMKAYRDATADDITYSISRVSDLTLDFGLAARRLRFNQHTATSPASKCCKGACKQQQSDP